MKKNITEWEVLTPTGWSDFTGIQKLTSMNILKIICDNGEHIECTPKHKIFIDDENWVYANTLSIGDTLKYKDSSVLIESIIVSTEEEDVYDLLNVEHDNKYFANGFINHNCAFIANNIMEDLWSSVYPIISSSKDSKCILVSTPNGTGNLYYDMYQRAEINQKNPELNVDNDERWVPFRIDWWQVPGRDEKWKQQQRESMNYDDKKFAQEFGNEFLGSSYTLVDATIIMTQRAREKIEPHIENINDIYRVRIWHKPDTNRSYSIGVDVGDGTGKDSTVISVWDITNPIKGIIQVAEFADNMVGPTEAAYISCKLGTMYNFAPLMIERNNMGNSTVDFCNQIYEYENIASIGSRNLGVLSNNKLKVNACLNLRKYMGIAIEVNSPELLLELEYFERKNTGSTFTYSAPSGKHDDYALAAIWSLFILDPGTIEYFFDVTYEKIGIQHLPKEVRNTYHGAGSNRMDELKKLENKWSSLRSTDGINNNTNEEYQDAEIDDLGFLDM
jgi:hypothetical protein